MIRVLFVTGMHPTAQHPDSARGVIVRRLARAITRLGHEIRILELSDGEGFRRYLRARTLVIEAVRAFRPDLVHVHFGYSGLAVPRIQLPLVTSFNGDDLNGTWRAGGGRTLKSRIGILVSHVTAWRSQRCIAVSAPLRQRLRLRTLRERTVVIRDAVDVELFRPLSKAEARRRLGLGADARLVLFPHNAAEPTKRVWLAEAAVRDARAAAPTAQLWVVNGQEPDDMPWYYAAADAVIVTSVLEGGPSSVKEALACGIPVVSVPVGDVQLFHEVPDLLIRAEPTAEDLARGLILAFDIGRAPRRCRVPSDGTLPVAARRMVDLYRDVLAAETRSRG